jgi:hypothetical protein
MNNPETRATLGTKHRKNTNKRHNIENKNNTDPTKMRMNPGALEG